MRLIYRLTLSILPFSLAFVAAAPAIPFTTASLLRAQSIPSPEQHFGHVVGADRKLVGWDGIVEYLQLVGRASDRVEVRELGKSTLGRPFLLVQVSSPETIANLDRYKRLQQRLYFQGHRPGQDPGSVHSDSERREIFDEHKAVVLITATIHSTEVGAAQMSLELVHHLATDNSPKTRKILDNTIFLLVPSLNPDGQDMVVTWYDRYVGTEYEAGFMPWLYQAYVGHDNNRDMYMYSQQETRLIGEVLYKEWFPSIWLDEHQMGSTGPRIFTMPATDPINLNVHPLIYRMNGVYGQAQGAALEAAGKVGITYDYVYTNFWPGAMAWTGWWHNQVGMLTEVASVNIATPTEQRVEELGVSPTGPRQFRRREPGEVLPKPRDTQPRTTYPRPWLGGKWTLRDIVEYEFIITMALLETAADTRGQLLRQIYEINRETIEEFMEGDGSKGNGEGEETDYGRLPGAVAAERAETGRVFAGSGGAAGTPYAILIDADQHDPPTMAKMLQTLELAGVIVERATASFEAGSKQYDRGTYVIRLGQVFGRYAKDMLEVQTYPEVRLAPGTPPRPPYDVTAWSLGMQMGVEAEFVDAPFKASLEVVEAVPVPEGQVEGRGDSYVFSAVYNDAFAVANRLWSEGARLRRAKAAFTASNGQRVAPGAWVIDGVSLRRMQSLADEYGLSVLAMGTPSVPVVDLRKPRIAMYQPWGSNMDEGWTRWLLEHYGFDYTTLHPQDVRAAGATGDEEFEIPVDIRAQWPSFVADRAPTQVSRAPLADRFDVLLFAHQNADDILDGRDSKATPPAYRGGIGEQGLAAVRAFVDDGGTVVALGSATELFIENFPIPVRNVAEGLSNDELLIPGSIVNIQTDPTHPLAWGMPQESYGYFIRSPFFARTESFSSQTVSVPVRYPNTNLRASGWLRGEEHLAGQAAAVEVAFEPMDPGSRGGRIILYGLRPQHRVQTHATFKLLFNGLMVEGQASEETVSQSQ